MMERLMSGVARRVTGLKIHAAAPLRQIGAEVFQTGEVSVNTSLMLLLFLSRRNSGSLFIPGIIFPMILHPLLN